MVVTIKGTVLLTEACDGVCEHYIYLQWCVMLHVPCLRTMLHSDLVSMKIFFDIYCFNSVYEKSYVLNFATSKGLRIHKVRLQLTLH